MTHSASALASVPLVEVTRGDLVEGVHFGAFAVCDTDGRRLVSAGDVEAPFYPRSTLKPLQLLAMLRLGLELPDDLLALAAASHSGALEHIAGARRILSLYELDESALGNAVDLPYGTVEREAHLAAGGTRSRLAQNCSGKHAAMVATCQVNGWDLTDYLDPTHPLQQHISATITELTGDTPQTTSTDGCGTPLPAISLTGMARAFARLSAAPAGTSAARVAAAMRAHPDMVAGEHCDVTALMRAVPGLIAKDGAEAVQLLGVSGLGIAIKIADGSDRARLPIATRILASLPIPTGTAGDILSPPILGGGREVGGLHVTREVEDRLGEWERARPVAS
ncbi:asparaginase [Brevibacterium spongiae]|uniref:Asparaginase n=1 Tax=Brevibacterium spongiae TaxID=2909672 RepID=A0ABY5SSP2_9MICO|nr:asparaginase [Brevibacterium spongiae]UVI36183.1 asparaginase [Brevibacterium spongiae]